MLLPTTGKTENLASTTKNTRRANLRHKELDYIPILYIRIQVIIEIIISYFKLLNLDASYNKNN